MDILTLKGLQYHARHGYYESERAEGNLFEVDLVFYAPLDEAGKTDDLNKTINYEQAEQAVARIMNGTSVKLLETLAERIGGTLFDDIKIAKKIIVRVRKLNPPLSTSATYSEIERQWSR